MITYLVLIKKIIVNQLIKVSLIIKYKSFIGINRIKDQKNYLALFKKEDNLRNTF